MAKPKTTPMKFRLEPIPVHPQLDSWFMEGNAGALKELVYNENHRKAEALLKEQARPSRASLKAAETNSAELAWFAGYCDAFRDLRRLCVSPRKGFKPNAHDEDFASDEWNHIT